MKKVWILNHYATNMSVDKDGRHYNIAKNLIEQGYKTTIFCASTFHNSNNSIEFKEDYLVEEKGEIPFVFVKATKYQSNNHKRLLNMYTFYRNLKKTLRSLIKSGNVPDYIIASSVHPLTLLAGIQVGEEFGIPCISEVRDLWPESIVAYGYLKRENPIAKILYKLEKNIYMRSNAIIMTWPGGKQYVIDQEWGNDINLDKVFHVSNGIILNEFDQRSLAYIYEDPDLDKSDHFNIVYTGSIRKVNNLDIILDAAKLLEKKNNKIRFLIFGTGDELDFLIKRKKDEKIQNVVFKGKVDKKYIPNILKKADATLLHNTSTSLNKYGQSQNKLFEYLAAGKPIIQTYHTEYSVIEKFNNGIVIKEQNGSRIAQEIYNLIEAESNHKNMGENSRNASKHFDFKNLTKKIIEIFNLL